MVIRRKVSDLRHCFRYVALLATTLSPPSVRKQLAGRIETWVYAYGLCTLEHMCLCACHLFKLHIVIV